MLDDKGQPTRLALSAHAWGEPVPKTMAAAKKLADKGHKLLEQYQATKMAAKKSAAKKSAKKAAGKKAVGKAAGRARSQPANGSIFQMNGRGQMRGSFDSAKDDI